MAQHPAEPDYSQGVSNMVNTITERQTNFLATLVKERDYGDGEPVLEGLRQRYREGVATSADASAVISWLLNCPKKVEHTFEPGIYSLDGALYRVYLGQNSGRMLCKRILVDPVSNDFTYEYAGAADRHLQGSCRLTRQEVAEHSLAYGMTHCMICGRRLDDPESVDRGVGPVCWENYV